MSAFQKYLQGLYPSLDSLNKSWGTSFKTWGEVRRTGSPDTKALAPETDHSMFMRRLYAEWIDQSQGGIRRFIPDAKVGFSVSWGDAWELSRYLSMTIWHRRVLYYDPHLSYGRPGMVFGTWYGPTYNKSDRNEARAHHDVWAALFGGANAFFEWWGARHMGYNFVRPDLSLFNIAGIMSREVKEIKGGIGKLLIESERPPLPVAILDSSRSSAVRGALKAKAGKPEVQKPSSTGSFRGTLRKCQIPVRYVHSEQVEDGVLERDGIRLLYMSRAVALSELEVKTLTEFVAAGGTLVADYDPGLRDEHGNVRETADLLSVFGVELAPREGPAVASELEIRDDFEQVRFAGLKGGLPAGHYGTNVAVGAGQALGSIGGKFPAVAINRHGKGLAVYLNFHPGAASGEQASGFLRKLIECLIAQAGVKRAFSVLDQDGALAQVQTGVFQRGNLSYIGIIAKPEGLSLAEQEKLEVTLKSRREGYFNDVRRGKALGKAAETKLTLTPGVGELFSHLPYAVEGIDLSMEHDSVAPGKSVKVKAQVRTTGDAVGDHVLVVRVTDAKGRTRPEHGSNVLAAGGKCAVELPIALNDPTGKWSVAIRDVATGTTATRSFQVAE